MWWLFIQHDGVRKAKRIGRGREAKETAKSAALQIEAALARGDRSALERPAPSPPPPTAVTFADYARRWLTETVEPHRKARTAEYYRQIVERHLIPRVGALPLDGIKPADVRAFIAERLRANAARNTAKNAAATLRAILYQAQLDELIPSNPAARFGRFFDGRRDTREHVNALEAGDVARILTTAATWYAEYELAVRLLFLTGMREGELLALQWEDVDWQRGLIDVRRTVAFRQRRLIVNAPKSGKGRSVDVPAALMARLRDVRSVRQVEAVLEGGEPSPWIVPSLTDPARPLNDAWFRDRLWRPLLDKAEVRHVRVHDARHTYASMMLRRGVPVAYVSRQLGHSSIQITVDLYGHFIPGADRHHVEGLAEAIETADAGAETQLDATTLSRADDPASLSS